jgi:hypothetical protein
MEVETPAEGIMKIGDWGRSKAYRLSCECSNPDHSHDVWVEADEGFITVTTYTTVKSKWWSKNRWQTIWTLLTKGYVECESDLIMSKQQAMNYTKTLESAILDVETFKKQRKNLNA